MTGATGPGAEPARRAGVPAQGAGPASATGPAGGGPAGGGPAGGGPAGGGPAGGGPDEDDLPRPDLPPLPADPRWKVEHLPFLTAVSVALMLCAASVGFLTRGGAAAVGAAVGVALVTLSFTMSTLVIAWADTVRPALIMPLGLLTYVVKYTLLGGIMVLVLDSGWPGKVALGWGVVAGVLGWTAVQIWWVTRLITRR